MCQITTKTSIRCISAGSVSLTDVLPGPRLGVQLVLERVALALKNQARSWEVLCDLALLLDACVAAMLQCKGGPYY